MDLADYRQSPRERARVADLLRLVPAELHAALDVGARDGHLSQLLVDRVEQVTALDLDRPVIDDPRIQCVKGNAASLEFSDASFDLVLCAEVLEHIPVPTLATSCAEMSRVSRRFVLLGVPFRQDIRLCRTTCHHCGGKSPPWGHVNTFDVPALADLFPDFVIATTSYVGQAEKGTNALSTWLMDLAGNPYGTYVQDEPCVHCGSALRAPEAMSIPQRALCKAALTVRALVNITRQRHANWVHVLMERRVSVTPRVINASTVPCQ